jgi:hypothetical protein
MPQSRTDASGRAYAGSQLQLQLHVNERQQALSEFIVAAIPALASLGACLCWVSPLEANKRVEYYDNGFLSALGLERLRGELRAFWPRGGPHWDALAQVVKPADTGFEGALLVEAKSYPDEIYSRECQAKSPRSLRLIADALEETKRCLGADQRADWMGELYQYANRLAHLHFLRKAGVQAWLANVYFLGDPRSPTTREQWRDELERVKAKLGLAAKAIPHMAEVFLDARPAPGGEPERGDHS